MKFIASLLFVLAVPFLLTAQSPAVRESKPPTSKSRPRHYMRVTVDKVDNTNTDGVSRVSCSLVGIPHTSSRIDSVTAVIGNKIYKASDIDGVDFERYFQWEDEGVVPVDVDLKRTLTFNPGDSIVFHTVHGKYAAPFKTKR